MKLCGTRDGIKAEKRGDGSDDIIRRFPRAAQNHLWLIYLAGCAVWG